jgi:hypothetical protein
LGRGEKEDEKILTAPLTLTLSPAEWRGRKREGFLKFICEFFNFSLEGKIKF